MTNYICKKCGKEFIREGNYTKHLNKIPSCKVENENESTEEKLENLKLPDYIEGNKV